MENEAIIKYAKKTSQDILDRGEKVLPMCLVFKKDGGTEVIGMAFDGVQNKEKIRDMLKKHLLGESIEKYAVIFDAKMTALDKKGKGEPKVMDVILISIYTAKDKITRGYLYEEDKKLKDNDKDIIKIDGRTFKGEKVYDCWDIWGEEAKIDTKENKEYQEYKKAHKELYRGLDSEEDEILDIKTKGKIETIDIAFGSYLKLYRYQGRVLFEAINNEGKVFLATKVMDEDEEFNTKLKEVKETFKRIGEELGR